MLRRSMLALVLVGLTACALLTDLDGLSGNPGGSLPDGARESAADRSDATNGDTDAGPNDDAGDAGPTADAGLECTPVAGPSCTPGDCVTKTLYAKSGVYIRRIVTDPTAVYWIETDSTAYPPPASARIMRADRTGATDASRATELTSLAGVTSLVLDQGYVYLGVWQAADGGGSSKVVKLKADCAPPCAVEDVATSSVWNKKKIDRLVHASPGVLVACGENLVSRVNVNGSVALLDTPGYGVTCAVTDRMLYTSSPQAAGVREVPPDGTQAAQIFAPLPDGGGMFSMATDCDTIFGSRHSPETIAAVSLATREVTAPFASVTHAVEDLTADARWLYGASYGKTAVLRIDKADGGVAVIESILTSTVATDDLGVYWGALDGTGAVRMMVK
ncbi:MAG: hypothetical protein U0270_03090 [Labilithrix sp.]